jgi:hypothetical protein
MPIELYINPVTAGIVDDLEESELLLDQCQDEGTVVADKLTAHIQDNTISLRRGDVVSVIPRETRDKNDGVFIWDGAAVVPLEYELNEYSGHVPRDFEVTDDAFSPDYWFEIIQGNGIFHLPDEILERFNFEVSTGEEGDLLVTSEVRIGDKIWTVTIQEPEGLDDPDNPLSGTPEFFKTLLLERRFRTEYVGEPGTFDLTY